MTAEQLAEILQNLLVERIDAFNASLDSRHRHLALQGRTTWEDLDPTARSLYIKRAEQFLNLFTLTPKEISRMDFRTAVIESLDRMIASDAITKMIDKAIGETIASVIKSELGSSYSDFGKQLTEAVKASLALNGSLDLPSYNDAIIKIAQKKMASLRQDSLEMQVAKQLEELLETAPAEITLSALVGQYVESLRQRHEGQCGCEEKNITLIVEKSNGNFTYVCLDDEPKKPKYQCDIQIGVNRNEVFSLRLGGADVAKQLFVGPLYDFERTLFQLHAAKTKVIFDVEADDIETSYGGHE